MSIYEVDPLTDTRWEPLLSQSANASVFHSRPWLEALYKTYRYTPIAYTNCSPTEALKNALVFCRIESWLTGRRLVSLPFSDHCEPLGANHAYWSNFYGELIQRAKRNHCRYIEIRSAQRTYAGSARFQDSTTYWLHQLDLSPGLDMLLHGCHQNSTQRKIRRAEREGLIIKEGQSSSLLDAFYALQLLTRRRHGLPPQPRRWFDNLANCFGKALTISVAFQEEQPAAAILTLRFKDTLVYKYGCSDPSFHRLGAMQLLFWNAIQKAKQDGLQSFDLGRSDMNDSGLAVFKDRWGAKRSTLAYARYCLSDKPQRNRLPKTRLATPFFRYAPDTLLSTVGNLLYRHIG